MKNSIFAPKNIFTALRQQILDTLWKWENTENGQSALLMEGIRRLGIIKITNPNNKPEHENHHHWRRGWRRYGSSTHKKTDRRGRDSSDRERKVHLLRQLRTSVLHRRHHRGTWETLRPDPRSIRQEVPHRREDRERGDKDRHDEEDGDGKHS